MNQPTTHASTPAAPSLADRLFGYPSMQFSIEDAPELGEIDLASEIARIEQAARDAESAASAAAKSGASATSSPAAQTGPGVTLGKSEIVELALQTWRLARRVEGLDAEKFPRERKQFADSLRRFQRILETHRVEVVDPAGQIYVDGWMEVEVVSWEPPEESGDSSQCRIKQTIAPIVRRNGEIIARGQVVATDVVH